MAELGGLPGVSWRCSHMKTGGSGGRCPTLMGW